MKTVKTCLLVTDDPDDHQAFTEALSEISDTAVVLIVLDSQKALTLIKSRRHAPDFIFLDLSMHGVKANTFLASVRNDFNEQQISTVVYGEDHDLTRVDQSDGLTFFSKEYEYSELREFLKEIVNTHNNR